MISTWSTENNSTGDSRRASGKIADARPRANQEIVINIDLEDFFGTVSFAIVKEIFENQFNWESEAAETLARITTYHNCLPQGAPSIPALANCAAPHIFACFPAFSGARLAFVRLG